MRKAWLAAALALPLIGLLAGIAMQEVALRNATVWRIPITGYDPRDLLRGRYITFRYDWAFEGVCRNGNCLLCLEDGGARVRIVERATPGICPGKIDPQANDFWLGSDPDGQRPTVTGRIFVSETSAPVLESQLRERPMVVVARLTPNGRLVNERLEPAR